MGLISIIVQPNAKVYSYTARKHLWYVHHLVDFPLNVDNYTVASVSHSASLTQLLILIHSMSHTMLYRCAWAWGLFRVQHACQNNATTYRKYEQAQFHWGMDTLTVHFPLFESKLPPI